MNMTLFAASQSPGSGHYDQIGADVTSYGKRSPRADLNRDHSPKKQLVPTKRDDSPSPLHYKEAETNWKKLANYRSSSSNQYTIKKQAKTSFVTEFVKAKSKVPDIGRYKDDMERYLKLSKGPAIPHYKRGR